VVTKMVIKRPKLWAMLSAVVFISGIQAKKQLEDTSSWDYIRDRVSKTIKQKINDENLQVKDEYFSPREINNRRKYHPDKDIYMLPHLPFYASYFNERDFVQVSFGIDWASQAYSSSGRTQNLSHLIFGEKKPQIQDILLASKLARAGKLLGSTPLVGKKTEAPSAATKNITERVEGFHFLSILADQCLNFKASFYDVSASLNYAHHFYNNHIALGIHAPLKMRKQRMHLTNEIDRDKRQKLQDVGNPTAAKFMGCDADFVTELAKKPELDFYRKYKCLKDFVEDILCKKCINFNEHDTTTGFGDLTLYLNADIHTSNADRFVVGASVQIPTTGSRNTKKLWGAELGNGGFVELSLFASMVYHVKKWFNPYASIKGTYGFKNNVHRRIPQIKEHAATTLLSEVEGLMQVKNVLLCGNTLRFGPEGDGANQITTELTNKFAFSEPDTTLRRFARATAKVSIRPGQSFFFRVGNTIDSAFCHNGFFDFHYDLFLRGKDEIKDSGTCKIATNKCGGTIITDNTWQVSHTIGADYSYQCGKHYRVMLGGSWVFAGRNAERLYGAHLTFNGEF